MYGLIYPYAAAALLGAVVAATGAWQLQGWRLNIQIADLQAQYAREREQAQTAAQVAERKLIAKYQGALNEARRREAETQAAAGRARTELDRLRIAADAAIDRARTADTCTPGVEPAAARDDVLGACQATIESLGRELVDIANRADRHTDDIRTLIQAWPKD